MTEEKVPQTDVVPEGTPLPEGEKLPGGEKPPEPQPLTEEKVQQMIAESSQLAEQQGEEKGRRWMQSKKNGEVTDALRRAKLAEDELAGVSAGLGDLDDDAKARLELARYRSRDQHYQKWEQEEAQRRQFRETYDAFNANMNQFIAEVGLDPNDKRIDWGDESEPLLAKQQRILGVVGKLQKEKEKESKDSVSQQVKDAEAKIRKDLGLDSVDTSASAGGSADWDKVRADFIKNPSNPKVYKRYMEEKEKRER